MYKYISTISRRRAMVIIPQNWPQGMKT